ATTGKRGPVYLDMPGDVLYQEIDESEIYYPSPETSRSEARPEGDPDAVRDAIRLLGEAQRPIIVTGSGILWSAASEGLQRVVELSGIPFYTTPQGRGVIPDDHALSFLAARHSAF